MNHIEACAVATKFKLPLWNLEQYAEAAAFLAKKASEMKPFVDSQFAEMFEYLQAAEALMARVLYRRAQLNAKWAADAKAKEAEGAA